MADDLAVLAFQALRNRFFDEAGHPVDFVLRDKAQTQDDPFDVEVAQSIERAIPDDVRCLRASGPLVSPDMALVRPVDCANLSRQELRNDSCAAVGIEVKKLERTPQGSISRASGLDYNSTPPCGTIRVYDSLSKAVDMRAFYLFVCMEAGQSQGTRRLTAMALCDGDVLNADFAYYISITGERSKDIGVGTYGDGANRNRPMVIFANPLGASVLDHKVTLVHRETNLANPLVRRVGTITRTAAIDGRSLTFTCYRDCRDDLSEFDLNNPFPTPLNRTERTSGRGRFSLPITTKD